MKPIKTLKIMPDETVNGVAILGGIIGTIIFVVSTFSEWYADFDIEPVGIITGLLTIVVFLLPFAISVLIGGGAGFILGGLLVVAIDSLLYVIVTAIKSKIEERKKRKAQKRASKQIRIANKNIEKDIEELTKLKAIIVDDKESIVHNMNLCLLVSHISDSNNIDDCLNKCKERYAILKRIRELERKIEELSKEYELIGDQKNADYYKVYIS